jgi:DNA repair exonuclease SbcCD ATPase subunit
MPGAVDVLVEIQFEADDVVLKEINALLEKEANILKTIADRLQQLQSAMAGQGAIASQLKSINAEIEQTNRLLQKMHTGYKEVDYAAESLRKQDTVWSRLALAMREPPNEASEFKAVIFELISLLPQLGTGLDSAGKSGKGLFSKASIFGLEQIRDAIAVLVTELADQAFYENEALKQIAQSKEEYTSRMASISAETQANRSSGKRTARRASV